MNMLVVLESNRAQDGACSGDCGGCSRASRIRGDAISVRASGATDGANLANASRVTLAESRNEFAGLSEDVGPTE
jgi:hypothetical protein